MKPKFSFIIPTLNEEKYIGGCLDSIRKQKRPDYEIIVVDSYSKDSTINIARKYKSRVLFEGRKGPSIARNTGSKHAKGEILVFADADVRFTPNFLDMLDRKFDNAAIGGGICDIHVYDSRKKTIHASYAIANFIAMVLIKIGKPMTAGSCFAFRKAVMRKAGGFNPRFMTNEDHDLADRVSKLKKFAFFGDITVYTSSRRVEKLGIGRSTKLYFKSTAVYFLNHSYLRDYWK